ncbi:MAG TPA: outer membrane beta-barrel protein [Prolixibacteraceae bacterium]|jgi:hypothetical protein
MIKDKNIDKLFREKLQDYEPQPPAWLLDNVLAGVAGAKRRRKIVYWRVAGVAAALLLAFVAGWQVNYMNRESVKQPVVVSQNLTPPSNGAMKAVPENETITNQSQQAKSTGVPRFSTADSTPAAMADKTNSAKHLQLAGKISQGEKNALAEPSMNQRIDQSASLYLLKTIHPTIGRKDQYANALHESKGKGSINEQQALAFDQQIIERNAEQLRLQNESQRNAHWLVGAQVSPAYSVNRSSHSAQYASNMLNSSSNTPVDLGGGLSVEYKPGKRWSLQSGVYIAGLGQSTGNSTNTNRDQYAFAGKGSEYFNAPVDVEATKMSMNSTAGVIQLNRIPDGIVLGTNLEDKSLASAVVVSDARFIQNFQYLEIPLYLRYTVLDARFDVELIGGLSSNVLIGNDTYMESSSGRSLVGKTQDMQGLNYSGTFGLGLKYGLSRRLFLNVEPRVKYFLNSLNTNAAVTYKPYTIGVYTGISYQF